MAIRINELLAIGFSPQQAILIFRLLSEGIGRGEMAQGEWKSISPVVKLLLTGTTGTVVIDARSYDGEVMTSFVTYTLPGDDPIQWPDLLDEHTDLRATYTGDAQVEVL